MDNKHFIEFCNKINCDTYIKLKQYLWVQGVSLYTASQIAEYQNSLSELPLELLGIASALGTILLVSSEGEKYTKDITKIRELYKLFLEKYNYINRLFKLKNPIEIYTMFNCLLYDGYLSREKRFEFGCSKTKVSEIDLIHGSRILTGGGVCRHVATMLTDIMLTNNIESSNIVVYVDSSDENIVVNLLNKMFNEEGYTLDELLDYARETMNDEKKYNEFVKFIEKYIVYHGDRIEISRVKTGNKKEIRFGNHLITGSYQDGKAYYLDPTHQKIYHRVEDKLELYDKDYGIITIKNGSKFNNRNERKKLNEQLQTQYLSEAIEEEQRLVDKTKMIYSQNTDIFEQFYKDNNELYDEITNEMRKVRALQLKLK